jgi:hypothetical protein
VNNKSQPSPSNSSEIYTQAADGQLNDKLQRANMLTSFLCADTLLSTYITPGTIPHTLLSTNATPDTNPHTLLEAPLLQSSPRQRRHYNIPTPNLSETHNNQEERRGPGYQYLIPSTATQHDGASFRSNSPFDSWSLSFETNQEIPLYKYCNCKTCKRHLDRAKKKGKKQVSLDAVAKQFPCKDLIDYLDKY